MGKPNQISLEQDRAFDVESMNELLGLGKSILDNAISISEKVETSIRNISDVYYDINGAYQVSALGNDITNMSGKMVKECFQDTIDRMCKLLTKLINDMPYYDIEMAQSVESLQDVIYSLQGRVEDLKSLLETDAATLNHKEFRQRLIDLKAEWNTDTEDLRMQLEEIENEMLGVCAPAVQYSCDPVNLSTGNFVYDHEDIKVGGEIPLTFHRYYNAKDRAKGSLGRCFRHNYEIWLIENIENGKVTVCMGDGQRKTFKRKEDGTYQSLHSALETLTKGEKGYILESLSASCFLFNQDGKIERLESRQKKGITFEYDVEGRLDIILTDYGAFLKCAYDEDGFLNKVSDHTGRTVLFTYEKGKLATVTKPEGGSYKYCYGKNGRIEEIVNPRGSVSVKNTYDEKRRITYQEFPDGGSMTYVYDDAKRQVVLTERNGSRIIYVHDGKYRNTDVEYEDGTKEHFEYNGKNQRILAVDRNGNSTRMAYDNRGNLTQVINALGEKTSITYNADNQLVALKVNGKEKLHNLYDSFGNLISSKGADGSESTITYDEQKRPVRIENADKSITEILYDERGNIVSINDAGGKCVRYEYDSLNRVICTLDGNGNTTAYEYDQEDRIRKVTNPLGATRSYDYNESGKVTQITDYDGCVLRALYNDIGKVSEITDKEGNVTRFTYDRMWNTDSVIQADGGNINYIYDSNNRLCEKHLPEGGSICYTYDGNGNRTGITDAMGNHTAFAYDALNRIVKVTDAVGAETDYSYDEEGNLICITDAVGNQTSFTYDAMKRCTSKTDVMGHTTTYIYDCMGNVEGILYPNGCVEKRIYRNGRLVEYAKTDGSSMHYSYDGNGNCIAMENAAGEKLTITYDALNRKKSITNPSGGTMYFEYDVLGNVTKVTDGMGNETCYTYTPNGNLKSVMDALGNETRYDYSAMGKLVKVERIGEAEPDSFSKQTVEMQVTTYEWNQSGLVTSIVDPLGGVERFGYDRTGRMTDKWDKDNYHTTYQYDSIGLITDILYDDGKNVSYQYDALRRLQEIKDSTGITRIVTDALGRVTEVTNPEEKTVGYEWGSMNEKLRLVYPDGKEAQYHYNEKGQLDTLSTAKGSVRYGYDVMGRLTEKAFPNGITTEYSYNTMGRLEMIRHTGDGFSEEYAYQYDVAGNKTEAYKHRQGMEADSGTFGYGYDALNRLTEVYRDGSLLRRYTYDAFGNRTLKEDYSGEESNKTVYYYNANNQMIRRISGEEEQNYTYDGRGNLTAVSRGEELLQAFTFNSANRMSSAMEIRDGLVKRAEYSYNGFGNRVGQTISHSNINCGTQKMKPQIPQNPEKQIHYTLDLTRQYHNLLMIENDNEEKSQTFYWDGNVAAVEDGNMDGYYLQDDLGSPMQLMDKMGVIRESYGYDEFGVSLEQYSDKQLQPFGYTGYQQEEVGGLCFAQARRYDAEVGRFVSEDIIPGVITMPFTLNRYCYCWNNPEAFIDLNGLEPVTAEEGIEAHRLIQQHLKRTVPGVRTEVPIPNASVNGNTGYADIVYINNGTVEIYEIKYISHLTNPDLNAKGKAQLNRYISNYYGGANPGTSLNSIIEIASFPSEIHPDRLIRYYIYESDPGMIYWVYVKRKNDDETSVVAEEKEDDEEKTDETVQEIVGDIGKVAIVIVSLYLLYKITKIFIAFLLAGPTGGGSLLFASCTL